MLKENFGDIQLFYVYKEIAAFHDLLCLEWKTEHLLLASHDIDFKTATLATFDSND